MTNKSMIDAEEAKKRETARSSGKSEKPLADEAHPHSPQLKPAVDEHQRAHEPGRHEDGNKSKDL